MDMHLCRFFYEFERGLAKRTESTPVTQLQCPSHTEVLALCWSRQGGLASGSARSLKLGGLHTCSSPDAVAV